MQGRSAKRAPKRMWGESFRPTPPPRSRRPLWFEVAVGFGVVFALALYVMSPSAPGRPAINAFVEARTTDQHFGGCDAARAAGRENIPRHDPSYRATMDGDGDGLACEPYYGRRD